MLEGQERISTLYNLTLAAVLEMKPHVSASQLCDLPGIVKEDLLRLALRRGKSCCIGYFLHTGVRDLRLSGTRITARDLESIAKTCPELRILEMNPPTTQRYSHPSDVLELLFSRLPLLVKVDVQKNAGMTDAVVATLAQHCRGLQVLDLTCGTKLTDQACVHLSSLPALRALNISLTQIGDSGVTALARGACALSLKELTLNGCAQVTNSGLQTVLSHCRNLTILLCCSCPKISDQDTLEFLASKNLILKRLCCNLGPTELHNCLHSGNCIVRTRTRLTIAM